MRKRVLLITLGAFFALIVVPVLITQLSHQQRTPRPPIDLDSMTYEDVRFKNPAAGIDLAGMLFVPEGEPPFPAVVIIHGSGTSRRTSPWYLTYARYLRENGMLVLLPDKRGSESSGGKWRTSSLEDLATDTQSAISYLRTERPALVQSIGILGVSQGGVIAPIVASETLDLAFVINVVGHAVSMHEQLLYEENNNLRQMGFLPGVSNMLAYVTTFVGRNISARDFWSVVGNFDPLPYWRGVNVPALVLLGDQDTNVPSVRSRDRLRALSKHNIQVVIFEKSGHGLEEPAGVGGDCQREDALEMIRNFILEATRSR
jgi:dipeptidyl aminopeptidase/acylaminoacyl peptidase